MNKSTRFVLAGLGGAFCLATFIMLIIFGKNTCTVSGGGNSADCSDLESYFATHDDTSDNFGSEGSSSGSSSDTCSAVIIELDSYITTKITCAWSTGTEVLGYIGIGIAVGFLVAFAFLQPKPFFWMIGSAGALGLLISIILMIVDIIHGQNFYSDYVDSSSPASSWIVFAINIILAFCAVIMTIVLTLKSYYIAKQNSPSDLGVGFRT